MRIKTREDERVELYLDVAGAVLLKGLPGVGKTSLLEHIARENNWEVVFYQATPGSSEEELLYKLLPSDETKAGVRVVEGALVKAMKLAKEGKKTLLIIDEWDKTRPSADAFLLDFLQNKRVSVPGFEIKLEGEERENLKVGLTSNDMRELSEPLLRRLAVVELKPLSPLIVRQILEMKHPQNPYIDNAVRLYELTLGAGLSKPATVQELDQLLSAIEKLGNRADWNTLVRELVIKDDTEWEKFTSYAEEMKDQPVNVFEEETAEPPLEAFEEKPSYAVEETKREPKLPRPVMVEREELEKLKEDSVSLILKGDLSKLLPLTDFEVSNVVKDGELVGIKGNYFAEIEDEKDLENLKKELQNIVGNEGEISLKLNIEGFSLKEVLKALYSLKDGKGIHIDQISRNGKQAYVRSQRGDFLYWEGLLRETPTGVEGEIIANIATLDALQEWEKLFSKLRKRENNQNVEVVNITTKKNLLVEKAVEYGYIDEKTGKILSKSENAKARAFAVLSAIMLKKEGFSTFTPEIARELVSYEVECCGKYFKAVEETLNSHPVLIEAWLGGEVNIEEIKKIPVKTLLFGFEGMDIKKDLDIWDYPFGFCLHINTKECLRGGYYLSVFGRLTNDFLKNVRSYTELPIEVKETSEFPYSTYFQLKIGLWVQYPKLIFTRELKLPEKFERVVQNFKPEEINEFFSKALFIDGLKATTARYALQTGIVNLPANPSYEIETLLKEFGKKAFKELVGRDQNLSALLGEEFVPFKLVKVETFNEREKEFLERLLSDEKIQRFILKDVDYFEYRIEPPDSPSNGIIVASEEDAKEVAETIAKEISRNYALATNNFLSLSRFQPDGEEMLRGIRNLISADKKAKLRR